MRAGKFRPNNEEPKQHTADSLGSEAIKTSMLHPVCFLVPSNSTATSLFSFGNIPIFQGNTFNDECSILLISRFRVIPPERVILLERVIPPEHLCGHLGTFSSVRKMISLNHESNRSPVAGAGNVLAPLADLDACTSLILHVDHGGPSLAQDNPDHVVRYSHLTKENIFY